MSTPSILIVEDETIVAADLTNRLRQLGYQVAGSSASGEEAIELTRRHRPDLVLMDIRLAGEMDGIAAAETIRRECDLPTVFLTAHSDAATLERAKLAEPFGYIVKPFDERDLRNSIELALHKHQAERKVREQREWFRVTLNSIGDAVVTCDAESRISFLNPVAETISGWTMAEVLGQPIQTVLRLINEGTRQPCEDPVARVLREGRPLELANHTALIAKDGHAVPIEDSAAPILDSAGRVIGAVLVFHDVTERRHLEKQMRVQSAALEAAANAVAIVSRAGEIEWVNPAFTQLTGYSRTEAVGQSPRVLKSGQHPPEFYKVMWETVLAGRVWRGEVINKRKDGTLYTEDMTITPVTDAGGEITHFIAIKQDVTERKQSEAALRESEERYRAVTALAPDAIFLHDAEGCLLDANLNACRLLGYSRDELLQLRVTDLETDYDEAEFKEAMGRVLAGEDQTVEGHHRRRDGTCFPVEARITALDLNGSRVFLACVRDITERKQAEKGLRQLAQFPEQNPNAVLRVAGDGTLLYANAPGHECLAAMIGEGKEELPASLRNLAAEAFQQALAVETEVSDQHGCTFLFSATRPSGEEYVNLYGRDITVRKRTEDKLRASLDRYRSFLEVTGQVGWTTNAEGEVVEDMPAWRKFTGQSIAEIQGWGWSNALHPDDLDRTTKAWREAVQAKTIYEVEYRLRRHDGVYRSFLARGVPTVQADGSIREWVGTCIDITEIKRSEQALRESREDLNLAQSVAHVGSWRLNVQRNELIWSDENWRIFGVPPGTPLTFETFLATVHPEDRDYVVQQWTAALRGAPYDIEHRIVVGETVKWVRERAVIEVDSQGTVLGGFGTTQDVTERKLAAEALRASEQRLQQAMRLGRCFAFEWSPETDEVLRTVECEPILGLKGAAAVVDTSHDYFQRVHPEDRKEFMTTLSRLAPDADTYTMKYRVARPDGQTVVLEETARASFGARGRMVHLVGIAIDVTERERLHRLQQENQARLDALLAASQELLAEDSVTGLLDRLAAQARRLTRGRAAFCGHGFRNGVFQVFSASQSDGMLVCPPGEIFKVQRGGVLQELLADRTTNRYTTWQVSRHPCWKGLPEGHAPLQGLLGARLVGADGKPCGLIMVTAREVGEFAAEDETTLGQLATSASLALQRLEAKEQAERRAEELAAVFDAMTDGVIIYNAEGLPVAANRTVTEAYGFNPVHQRAEDFTTKIRLGYADGRKLSPNRMPSRRALRGNTVRGEHFVFMRADGKSCTTITSAAPLRAGNKVTGAVLVWHDVTEREQMVRELAKARGELELRVEQRTAELSTAMTLLRESEERYRTLFQAAPLGIALTDPKGSVLDANPSLCSLFGVTMGEARSGRAVDFYTNPADRKRLLAELRRFGQVAGVETTLRTKSGDSFAALVQMSRVELHGRQALLSIVTDITQRKRAERRIHGTNTLLEFFTTKPGRSDYLQAVVELLRDWCDCQAVGIRLLDGEGRLPYVVSTGFSQRFLREETAFCVGEQECPCLRVVHGRIRKGDKPCVNERGSLFCNHVSAYLSKFGRRGSETPPCVAARFESLSNVPIRFQNRVVGSIHLADRRIGRFGPEVAEFIESVAPLVGEALHRFQVEEDLRESEQRFRSMFESHAAAMLLLDPESGTIVDANPPAARFYGYNRSELCAMNIDDLHLQRPVMPAAAKRALFGSSGILVLRLPRADGSVRTVEVHSSPVQVGGRRLLFSIIHDITERKELERRILEIGDEERQRIGQDLHDSLGGHLTGLALMGKGLARALAKKNIEESAFAEEIARGVNEAVTQTRAIARGLCPVGLGKLGLASSLEEYVGSVSRLLRVDCRVQTRGKVVIRDESVAAHLFRIAQEAVTNAVRHGKARRIRIQLSQDKGGLSLRVQDNGRGLPSKLGDQRGMGLLTMRYRAGILGAELAITSRRGKGALISCRIPPQSLK